MGLLKSNYVLTEILPVRNNYRRLRALFCLYFLQKLHIFVYINSKMCNFALTTKQTQTHEQP